MISYVRPSSLERRRRAPRRAARRCPPRRTRERRPRPRRELVTASTRETGSSGVTTAGRHRPQYAGPGGQPVAPRFPLAVRAWTRDPRGRRVDVEASTTASPASTRSTTTTRARRSRSASSSGAGSRSSARSWGRARARCRRGRLGRRARPPHVPRARLTAIDVSTVFLETARRNLAGYDVRFVKGEVDKLDLPAGRASTASSAPRCSSTSSIPRRSWPQIARLLRPRAWR